MNILLTNDDGYDSSGLQVLKEILKEYGTVYMVAPYTAQSGKGCGITMFSSVVAHKENEFEYLVEGTPVDCVMFAKAIVRDDFDLVVSGCNNGWNLSYDVMYSGTCGACFQSLVFGWSAIAFSSETYKEPWQIRQSAKMVIDYILSKKLLSKEYYLNVNLNSPNFNQSKGILITKLFERHTKYVFSNYDKNIDKYIINHFHDDILTNNDYDVSAAKNGFISITPIGKTPFDEMYYKEVNLKIKKE